MPTNFPVTLNATQATTAVAPRVAAQTGLAATQAEAVSASPVYGKNFRTTQSVVPTRTTNVAARRSVVETPALTLPVNFVRPLTLFQSETVTASFAKNLIILTMTQPVNVRRLANMPRSLTLAQSEAVTTTNAIVFHHNATVSTPVATVSTPTTHAMIFPLTQSPAVTAGHGKSGLLSTTQGSTVAIAKIPTSVKVIAQTAILSKTGSPVRAKTLTTTQAETVKAVKRVGHIARVTQAQSPVVQKAASRVLPTAQSTSAAMQRQPTRVLAATQSTTASNAKTAARVLPTAQATSIVRQSQVRPILTPTVTTTVVFGTTQVNRTLRITEAVVPVAQKTMTHSFGLTQGSSATLSRNLNKPLVITQSSVIATPKRALKKTLSIHSSPTVSVSPGSVRLTIPIMGFVYQPIDQMGAIVPVISTLSDYDFELNTDDVPSLHWTRESDSQDRTNDSVRFTRTK